MFSKQTAHYPVTEFSRMLEQIKQLHGIWIIKLDGILKTNAATWQLEQQQVMCFT